jgi:hypothetical protein
MINDVVIKYLFINRIYFLLKDIKDSLELNSNPFQIDNLKLFIFQCNYYFFIFRGLIGFY